MRSEVYFYLGVLVFLLAMVIVRNVIIGAVDDVINFIKRKTGIGENGKVWHSIEDNEK